MKFCLLALFIFSLNLSANDDCNDKLIEKLEKEYKKSKTVRGVPLEQYQWDILPGGIFFYKLKNDLTSFIICRYGLILVSIAQIEE